MHAEDKLGRRFEAGDFIAYGHALGRCAGLRIGKVLEIKRVGGRGYGYAVPAPSWRITVVGVDDDWNGRELELCRKGTLLYPNRCLVLDAYTVPDSYLELYRKAGL